MRKAVQQHDCVASAEAEAAAAALEQSEAVLVQQLPVPGEVEIITGGPPCQGFSNLNRWKDGARSKCNNAMVSAQSRVLTCLCAVCRGNRF